VARIDSLSHERKDVADEFEALAAKDLAAVNSSLTAKKLDPIHPPLRDAWEKANADADSGGASPAKEFRLSDLRQLR
jgi:hypothetical protein